MDNAATTAPDDAVVAYMTSFFAPEYANPASQHAYGRKAKKALESARERIASSIGSRPEEILFTSGGTESDNMALRSVLRPGDHLVVSAVEHHAVLRTAQALSHAGVLVSIAPVDNNGVVDLIALETLIRSETRLVSVMAANNETGTLQPIRQIARLAHEHGALFHTDAVQSAGSLPFYVKDCAVDLLSVSAHKFYAPRGAGFLFCRNGVKIAEPYMTGGDQEQKNRAGTENLPAICAMAYALERALADHENNVSYVAGLRARFESRLLEKLDHIQINSADCERLPGISNMIFYGVRNQFLLTALDMEGVMASAGAACSGGSLAPSHVLLAMGLDERSAGQAVRFSFGKNNTVKEADAAADIVIDAVARLRSPRRLYHDEATPKSV